MEHDETIDDSLFGFDFETFTYISRKPHSSKTLETERTHVNSHSGEGHTTSSNLLSSPKRGATSNSFHKTKKTRTNTKVHVSQHSPALSRGLLSLTKVDTNVSSCKAYSYDRYVGTEKDVSGKHKDSYDRYVGTEKDVSGKHKDSYGRYVGTEKDVSGKHKDSYGRYVGTEKDVSGKHNDHDEVASAHQRRNSMPQTSLDHTMNAESEGKHAQEETRVGDNDRECGDSCGKYDGVSCMSAEDNLKRNRRSRMYEAFNGKQSSQDEGAGKVPGHLSTLLSSQSSQSMNFFDARERRASHFQCFSNEDVDDALLDTLLTPDNSEVNCPERGVFTVDDIAFAFSGDETTDKLKLQVNYLKSVISKMKLLQNRRDHSSTKIDGSLNVSDGADVGGKVSSSESGGSVDRIARRDAFENTKEREHCRRTVRRRSASEGSSWGYVEREKYRLSMSKSHNPETTLEKTSAGSHFCSVEQRHNRFSCHTRLFHVRRHILRSSFPQDRPQTFQETSRRMRRERSLERWSAKRRERRHYPDRCEQGAMFTQRDRNRGKVIKGMRRQRTNSTTNSPEYRKEDTAAVVDKRHDRTSSSGRKQHASERCAGKSASFSKRRATKNKRAETAGRDCVRDASEHSCESVDTESTVMERTNTPPPARHRKHGERLKHNTQAYKRPSPITFDNEGMSDTKMLDTALHCLDPRAKTIRQSNNGTRSIKLENKVDQKRTNADLTKDDIERQGRRKPVADMPCVGILQNVRDTVCCKEETLSTDPMTLGPGSRGQDAPNGMETPISKKPAVKVEPQSIKQEMLDLLGEFCHQYSPLSPVQAEREPFPCFEDTARQLLPPVHSRDADVALNRKSDIGARSYQPLNASSLSVPCAGAIQYEVCGITVTQLFGTPRNPDIRPAFDPQLQACANYLHGKIGQDELCNFAPVGQDDEMEESAVVSESSVVLQSNGQQNQNGIKFELKSSPSAFIEFNQPCSLIEACTCCMNKNPPLTARNSPKDTTVAASNSSCFHGKKCAQNETKLETDGREMSAQWFHPMFVLSDLGESKLGTISTFSQESKREVQPDNTREYTNPYSMDVDNINNCHGCAIGVQTSDSHRRGAQGRSEGEETFICDDISSPIVLNASDRVYHVNMASSQHIEHSEHVKPSHSLGSTSFIRATEAVETGKQEDEKKDDDDNEWTGQEKTAASSEDYMTSKSDSEMDVLTLAMKSAGLTNDFLEQFFVSDVLLENFLGNNALNSEYDFGGGENFIDSLFPEDEEQENFLGQGSTLESKDPFSKIVMSTQSNSNQPGCSRTFSLSSSWAEKRDAISFSFQDFDAISEELNDSKTATASVPSSYHRYQLRHLEPSESSTLLFYEDGQLSRAPIDTCGMSYQSDDKPTQSLCGVFTKMNREHLSLQDEMRGTTSEGPTFSSDPDQMSEALALLPPVPLDVLLPNPEPGTETEKSSQATCAQQTGKDDVKLLWQRQKSASNYSLNREAEISPPQKESFINDIGRRRRELIKRCQYGKTARPNEGMMTRTREATEQKSEGTILHYAEGADPSLSDTSDFLFRARTLIFHQDRTETPKEAELETKNSPLKRKRKKSNDFKRVMECNELHGNSKNSHSCGKTGQRRKQIAIISGKSSKIPAQAGDSSGVLKNSCTKRIKCMKSARKRDAAPVTKYSQSMDVEIANKFTRQLKRYCPRLTARSRTAEPCRVQPRKLQTPLVVRKTYQGALRSALKKPNSQQSRCSQHLPMNSNNNADDEKNAKASKKPRQLTSVVKGVENTHAEGTEESEATIKRRLKQLHTKLSVEYASQSQTESLGAVLPIASRETPLLAQSLAKAKRSSCQDETSSPVAQSKDKCAPVRWSGGEAGIDRGRLGVLNFVSRLHTKYGDHFARAHNMSKDALNTMCFKYLDYQGVPPVGESKSQDEIGNSKAEKKDKPLKKTSKLSAPTGKTSNSSTQLKAEAKLGADVRSISRGKKESRKSAKNKKEEEFQPPAGDRSTKKEKRVYKFKYDENIMKAPPLTRISPLPSQIKTSDERESLNKEMGNALPNVGPPTSSKGKNVNVNRRQRRAIHSNVDESLNLRVHEEERGVARPKMTSLASIYSRKLPGILSVDKRSKAREDAIFQDTVKPMSSLDQLPLKANNLDSLSCSENEAKTFASYGEDESDVEFCSLSQLKNISDKPQTLFGFPNLLSDKGTKRYGDVLDTFRDDKTETQSRPCSKVRRSIFARRKTDDSRIGNNDKADKSLIIPPTREEVSDSRASSVTDTTISQEEPSTDGSQPQNLTTDLSSTSSTTAAHVSVSYMPSGLQEKCSEYQSRAAKAVESEDCSDTLDLESVVSLTELKQMVHKTAFPEWMEETDAFQELEKSEVRVSSVRGQGVDAVGTDDEWDFRACVGDSDKQTWNDHNQDLSAALDDDDDFWETGTFGCGEKHQGDRIRSNTFHPKFTINTDILRDRTGNVGSPTIPKLDYTRNTEDDDDNEFCELGLCLGDFSPAKYDKTFQKTNDMEKNWRSSSETTDNSVLHLQSHPEGRTASRLLSYQASQESSEKLEAGRSFRTFSIKHTITEETQYDIARQCSGNSTLCSGEISSPQRYPSSTAESNRSQPNPPDRRLKFSDFVTPPAGGREVTTTKDENEIMGDGKNEFDFENDSDRYEMEPLTSLKSVVTKTFDEAFSDFPFIGPGIQKGVSRVRSSTMAIKDGNSKNTFDLTGRSSGKLRASGGSHDRHCVTGNSSDILGVTGNSKDKAGLAGNRNDIPSVSGNRNDISSVSGNRNDIPSVSGNRNDISSVSGNRNDIPSVSGNRNDIPSVSGNRNDISSVSGNRNDISSVSGNRNDISSVRGNRNDIPSVSGNRNDISSVSGNSSDILGVTGNSNGTSNPSALHELPKS